MKIERSNILELIGTGKNKYHSCVITSYSIDLAFFEQLILPRLRGAGVTNINLFVDASMLEKYLASHLGDSDKKFNANYSITPVYITGAFHPKMLFLAGKDKGFLSIGSGNITSSGLLYNDEIWSSFYLATERLSAQPIFKSAWQYIQLLSSHSLGINLTKIHWIPRYSKWISALENIEDNIATIKDIDFKLSYTKKNRSLFNDVLNTLSQKPKSIKIIAPYYNRSGAFIQKLIDELEPREMHCVVDTSNGILPKDFKSTFCQFSDWCDVINTENSRSIQRLHAKIIQIEYEDETIFILGSANATLEAYGISKRNFKNDEAVITIHSKKTKDFIKELGIKIPKKGTLDIQKTINSELDNIEQVTGLLKIKHVELSDEIITISIGQKLENESLLKTFESNNGLLESIEVSSSSITIQTSLKKTESIFKVAIFNSKSQERISTFGLIQNVGKLNKSNPDERLARLQSFEHLDIFSSLNYELVLDFLDQEQIFKENNSSHTAILVNNDVEEDEGEVISENEYNKNASLSLEEQVTRENITSMVEEFLDVLKIRENIEELSTNSEEMAIEAGDDGMDESTSLEHIQSFINSKEGQRIARKIEKTITDVCELINNRSINKIPQDDKTLNALFIGFHILLHFWDELYIEELSEIKVYYTNLTELSKLESKFGLRRLDSQIESSNNEVNYYIDYSLLNTFKVFIDRGKDTFKIIGNPSEPKAIEHSIITRKYVSSFNENSTFFELINIGLCSILSTLKQNEILLNKDQRMKLVILSTSLLSITSWNKQMLLWRDLILLNVYETTDCNLNEFKKSGLPLLAKYRKFKKELRDNSIVSIPLNKKLIGAVIFSSNLGFGVVKRVLENDHIEFYSPLFTSHIKINEFGTYKEVFIGRNLKVFDLN